MRIFIVILFVLAAIVVSIGEKALLWHFCLLCAIGVVLGYLKLRERVERGGGDYYDRTEEALDSYQPKNNKGKNA